MSESLKSQVAATATTLENVTSKVDQLETDHLENRSRLQQLEDKVGSLAETGLHAAEGGFLGSTAQKGAGIVQEIVDFLHWQFPRTPGAVPVAGAMVPPGKPTSEIQAEAEGAKNAGVQGADRPGSGEQPDISRTGG